MSEIKRIVCLANSRKLNGRCIAGRVFDGTDVGPWIRPVGARENQEVSEYERQYEDGSDPKVLDIIDVPLRQHCPGGYQSENWLLDPAVYWQRAGKLRKSELSRFVDPVAPLWLDGHKTWNGENDKIPEEFLSAVPNSLRLVHVKALTVAVFVPGGAFGNPKRRVQGRFLHAGTKYALWITDPVIERKYLARPDGRHELDECCLTISVGEPYQGACYKLIAAVTELG